MDQDRIKAISDLILPILDVQHVDLIDMELKGKSGSQVLRIFVDIDGGISLDQCINLSRQISDLLDTKDLIAGRYRLEVSSPGLDRPLKTAKDFSRNLGRRVEVIYKENGEDKTIAGAIKQVDNNQVLVQRNSDLIVIEINKILAAKIVPIW